MKLVINQDHGGYGLSPEAIKRFAEIKGIKLYEKKSKYTGLPIFYTSEDKEYGTLFDYDDISRNDPVLIQVVEELGDKANGFCASLKIIEIPDGVNWQVEEYDGREWIAEKHETWS